MSICERLGKGFLHFYILALVPENLAHLNQEDDSDAKVEKANCIAFMGETKRADSHKEDAADKVEDGLQPAAIATASDVVEEDTWEDDSIAN